MPADWQRPQGRAEVPSQEARTGCGRRLPTLRRPASFPRCWLADWRQHLKACLYSRCLHGSQHATFNCSPCNTVAEYVCDLHMLQGELKISALKTFYHTFKNTEARESRDGLLSMHHRVKHRGGLNLMNGGARTQG